MKKLALVMSTALLTAPLAAQAAPAAGWTGPYVGVNAGYGLGNVTIDDQDCNISCSSQSFSPSGFTIGGTAGYNYQMGSAVLGVEGDYNYIDAKHDVVTDWPSHYKVQFKSYGTVRVRAGLAVDRALVYATAGLGIVDRNVLAEQVSGSAAPSYGFVQNKTAVGVAAGVGTEVAISARIRAKLEYLYIGVPADNNIRDQFNTNCASHTHCNYGVKSDLNVVRVGVNYAF